MAICVIALVNKIVLNEQYENYGVVSLINHRSHDVITTDAYEKFAENDKYTKPINIHVHNVDHLDLKLLKWFKNTYKKIDRKIMIFIHSIPLEYRCPKNT